MPRTLAPPGRPHRPRGSDGSLPPRKRWVGYAPDGPGAGGPQLSRDPGTPGPAQRSPARGHGGPS
eukprot:12712790-Alexandrium_andersonii.AAC.1